ncbi:MAG TPA: hypothetical protein VFR04_03490 [Solirubrobacterales bacterium]|nr:hypothetical protein [Solirubrobacterales bacterium]
MALTVMPAHARAASPVLEFVAPGTPFPIAFTADGGPVTAALTGFNTEVHCSDSEGEGAIVGPRSTLSDYVFTGCEAQNGDEDGTPCQSEGANAEEIIAEAIEADLVFISQAKHEVGMLLNPDGGVYMNFKCGGELVEATGPFLSPVGPINKEATSFTATLTRSGAVQTPSEYENMLGEKRLAIPMGKRGANPPATTGVELGFTINTSAPLQVKAITAAEIEARQHEDEAAAAAAAKRRHDEEAAAVAAAKRRQEEEAAVAAAVKARQEEEAKSELLRRAMLSSTLKQCRKLESKHKRARCEKRAKKQYGSAKSP